MHVSKRTMSSISPEPNSTISAVDNSAADIEKIAPITADLNSIQSQKADEEKSQAVKNEWENVQTFHDASFNST